MMASIVKLTHASLAEGKDPKMEITQWLLNYRNTPHPSTRKTPSELMMDRIVRTKVPVYIPTSTSHRETHRVTAQPGRNRKCMQTGIGRPGNRRSRCSSGSRRL